MSPIGGVGINLAVQDAVAAANLLAEPLRAGPPQLSDLEKVQRRRMFPTRFIQRLQVAIQDRIINRVLENDESITPPWPVQLFDQWPWLRRIPARVLGVGVRPEHVRTGDRMH